MDTRTFINDWHTIINFGSYKGQKLIDIPQNYLIWLQDNIKNGPVHDALVRINNRKGVTTIIKKQPIYDYIPDLLEDTDHVLPIIIRPDNINYQLYGNFVEYYIKYNLGIIHFDNVVQYLAMYNLEKLPENLKYNGDFLKPNMRTKYIHKSYNKKKYDVLDICNMSFVDSILMNTYNEEDGVKLFHYVNENKQYFMDYSDVIKNFPDVPRFKQEDQDKCDKISVGCVMGVIDAIYDTNIIDIKCCEKEDINYFRKQLFAYACLYYLRYGKYITKCKIFNIMTGKIFVMDISKLDYIIAMNHVKNMGCFCKSHVKLFE
jgi:hypothetical protein